MKLKVALFSLVVLTLSGCSTGSSSDGDSPGQDVWGYAENGNLNVEIEQVLDSSYTVTLSQNGTVYVTTDGTEPSASNYDYRFTYDYGEGVSSSDYKVYLTDVWEASIRVLGIADGYPTENENGIKILYEPPKAPEGTTVTFSKSVVITKRPVTESSRPDETDNILVIPESGTALCSDFWGDPLGRGNRYYLMEAGTTGTIRYVKKETNSGSFSACYMDGSLLTDGDAISAGTRFYLHAKQGDSWSNDVSATWYAFDFWIEE